MRVEREDKADVHNMAHPSEVELDGYDSFSIIIDNNGTLEDLEASAESIAKDLTKFKQGV